MRRKPEILVFVDWFWPGYLAGGPVQSVLSLVQYLGADVNFRIITSSTDLNSDVPYRGVLIDQWTSSHLGCEIYYADIRTLDKKKLLTIMKSVSFDAIYINSFLSKQFSIYPLQLSSSFPGKDVIIAPRGMLGAGALAIKPLKKKLFIVYSKLSGLHKNVTWHATSKEEESEIRAVYPKARTVKIISNLPKKISGTSKRVKIRGKLNLCFVSRISLKKNLLYALEVLALVRKHEIRFHIYGPVEDQAYWQKCQEKMKQMPANVTVHYKGILSPAQVEQVYAEEHILFLPTMNENFGHAIVEALMCGCPSVISDQTPWNDLERKHAGFALPLDSKEKFAACIAQCANFNQQEYNVMSRGAVEYISGKLDAKKIAQQYRTLFNDCA